MKYSELASIILSIPHRKMVLVGVDAPGSSGKSTLCRHLQSHIPGAQIVRMDDLQGGNSTAGDSGWEWGRLRDEVLIPLSQGRPVEYGVFSWVERSISNQALTVHPEGVIIIDGLYSTRQELQDYYDYKIWVDCPLEVKRSRATHKHAADALHPIEDWIAEEQAYIASDKPMARADLVVSGYDETPPPPDQFRVMEAADVRFG